MKNWEREKIPVFYIKSPKIFSKNCYVSFLAGQTSWTSFDWRSSNCYSWAVVRVKNTNEPYESLHGGMDINTKGYKIAYKLERNTMWMNNYENIRWFRVKKVDLKFWRSSEKKKNKKCIQRKSRQDWEQYKTQGKKGNK